MTSYTFTHLSTKFIVYFKKYKIEIFIINKFKYIY